LSSKTHCTHKIPKTVIVPPGTKKGPMQLPVSYNVLDYRIEGSSAVKIRRSPSDYRLVKGKPATRYHGANRYKSNKLLDAKPIK